MSFEKKEIIRRWVNDEATEVCIRAERAFLKTLHGGCSIPAFGYAHYDENQISLKAGIISLDGQRVVKVKRSADIADVKALGELVGQEVLRAGGTDILHEIRQSMPAL